MFVGRQQFISFLDSLGWPDAAKDSALQYLTTFSRGLSQPLMLRRREGPRFYRKIKGVILCPASTIKLTQFP